MKNKINPPSERADKIPATAALDSKNQLMKPPYRCWLSIDGMLFALVKIDAACGIEILVGLASDEDKKMKRIFRKNLKSYGNKVRGIKS
jgi:hypothetical protein